MKILAYIKEVLTKVVSTSKIKPKSTLGFIFDILLVVAISLVIAKVYNQYKFGQQLYKDYIKGNVIKVNNNISDSINNEIRYTQFIINKQTKVIDSISRLKQQTTNYYETNIKNLSNPNIVDDDSITSYISKKIHNQ